MHACLSQVKPQPVPAATTMRLWRANSQHYRLRTDKRYCHGARLARDAFTARYWFGVSVGSLPSPRFSTASTGD